MLGILGGMGPEASMLFYRILTENTPAESDQDHIKLMLLSHTDMPDRTETILSRDEKKIANVRDMIERDIKTLIANGCDKVVVTCNTAHYFIDMLSEKSDERSSVIHLIDETAYRVKSKPHHSKVAILATSGTIKTGLYQDALARSNINAFAPDDKIQQKVMALIYDYIKKGTAAPDSLWRDIIRSVQAAGCDCAILGCTELSILAYDNDLDTSLDGYFVDPLQTVADKCIRLYK